MESSHLVKECHSSARNLRGLLLEKTAKGSLLRRVYGHGGGSSVENADGEPSELDAMLDRLDISTRVLSIGFPKIEDSF